MPQSTIFFSSHVLGDVEELCSFVAVLRNGRLGTFCPIEALLLQGGERYDVVVRELPAAIERKYRGDLMPKPTPLGYSFTIDGTDELVRRLTELRQTGATIVGVSSQRRTLEEALFKEGNLSEMFPPTQALQAGGAL